MPGGDSMPAGEEFVGPTLGQDTIEDRISRLEDAVFGAITGHKAPDDAGLKKKTSLKEAVAYGSNRAIFSDPNKKYFYIRDKKNNEVLHRGPLTAKSAEDEMEQYGDDDSVIAVADQYNKSLWLPGHAKGPREKNTEYPDSPSPLSV